MPASDSGRDTPDDSLDEHSSDEHSPDEHSPDDHSPNSLDEHGLDDLVHGYLDSLAKTTGDGDPTGNSYRNATHVLDRWLSWCWKRGVETTADLDDTTMRRYAQRLRQRERSGAISASTARTYYAFVRAALSWGVADGRLDANPAAAHVAVDELPEDDRDPDDHQQFWTPAKRDQLVSYVAERARDAVEERGRDARVEVRDRALVAVLAFTGARGAELFSAPKDDRDGRNGLEWRRVDLDAGRLRLFRKDQAWEYAPLPPQAREYLDRHRRVQDPPTGEWPVFASRHRPSLYRAARAGLAAQGLEENEVEAVLDERDVEAVLREHGIRPPALSTNGARSIMERLCEEAGVEIDGEYLKPHGGRRGLGDVLYRESAELAQDALGHSSVETTHRAYSHVEAAETAERVGSVLDDAPDDAPGDSPRDESVTPPDERG